MSSSRIAVQFWAMARKEIRQTMADRRMMGLLIVAPLLQLTVFGLAVNLDVDRLPTVVVDQDHTPTSRTHVARLLADGTLVQAATADSVAGAEAMIDGGQAAIALVVPRGFERDLGRGEPTRVQVIVDGTNPNKSGVAQAAVARYFGAVAQSVAVERAARLGTPPGARLLTLRPRVLYNPHLATPPFMLPGVIAIMLLINTALLTAIGLAREKETGTLEQVLVTPISPAVLMLGKIFPSLVIGVFEFFLALIASAWIFDVPLGGSFALLLGTTFLFLLSTLGVGLFISTFSRTQQQAYMGGFLFLMPANLLSGMLTPISSMPVWLQPVTYLNPLRYYIEILRATLLKGAGLGDLWAQVVALGAFGVIIVAASSVRFRTRLA